MGINLKQIHPYYGELIVFSTAHHKDKILEKEFMDSLNIKFYVPKNLDTDKFGTFTGEVQRSSDLKEVLRQKAYYGLLNTDRNIVISSEGSFGPDPLNPFLFCNQENLLLMDQKNKIEIFASHRSYETSYSFSNLNSRSDLEDFLAKNPIESQPVVLKLFKDCNDQSLIFKGIDNKKLAYEVFDDLFSIKSSVWVESDLRAHMNVKRQSVIKACGIKLLEKILSLCPKCTLPGFSITKGFGRLACIDCGFLSEYPSHDVWTCADLNCNYEKQELRLDGVISLEPKYCSYCNP